MRPAIVIAAALLCAACTSAPAADPAPPARSAGPAMAADSTLIGALARITAADGTRQDFRFSDDGALRTIMANAPGPNSWGDVALFGSSGIGTESRKFGVRIDQALYTITVGTAPAQLTLIAGQQDPALLKTSLTKLGYKTDGDRLVAPKTADASPVAQARGVGQDLVLGGRSASLTALADDRGKSLAADPAVSALAGCLGDVVVAQLSGKVAVGVLDSPAKGADVRAVVCTSWDSDATASAEAAKQRSAYPAEANVEVTVNGQVVRAVSTVTSPRAMFDSLAKRALPGVSA